MPGTKLQKPVISEANFMNNSYTKDVGFQPKFRKLLLL
jgi:hypothetical protein